MSARSFAPPTEAALDALLLSAGLCALALVVMVAVVVWRDRRSKRRPAGRGK